MAVVRRNILTGATARERYVRGVKLLKAEQLGPSTRDLGLAGPAVPVSTYDLFVAWHHRAMETFTPPSQGDRNAAHRGPVFLPWHRFMMVLLEQQLQRVLRDRTFGLPYWDWDADGRRTPAQQLRSALWAADCMGGQGSPITSGPFAFDAADPASWRVKLAANVQGQLVKVDRGLRRALAQNGVTGLPTPNHVDAALAIGTYDAAPWSTTSGGFRNQVEGWAPLSNAPGMHNRVHVWVGGDMLPSSSPNDPVFFLNHCNEDRLWSSWQMRHPASPYLPAANAPVNLMGHRLDDDMFALISRPLKVRDTLDMAAIYSYDVLV